MNNVLRLSGRDNRDAKGAAQEVPEDSAELKQRQAERNHQRKN